jgi:uncharacterized coiled-coil protein SlyX
MTEERVTDLEIKVAYLERTVAESESALRTLGEQVELLRREVVRLRQLEREAAEPPASEKPPHY